LPQNQEFAASAEDPMKPAKIKGSKHASEAGFCCLCRRPEETCRDQRQQSRLRSRNLLPLPKTRRNLPSPKAANSSQEQEFVASAVDPMKLTKIKGSNLASKSRMCCLCCLSGEIH
jgi:hypothetical protein